MPKRTSMGGYAKTLETIKSHITGLSKSDLETRQGQREENGKGHKRQAEDGKRKGHGDIYRTVVSKPAPYSACAESYIHRDTAQQAPTTVTVLRVPISG